MELIGRFRLRYRLPGMELVQTELQKLKLIAAEKAAEAKTK